MLSAALPPTGLWPLLLALVPLFVLVATSTRKRDAFWLGFAFGLPFFTLYILWLPASFSTPEFFGSAFWLLYPPMLLILAAFWGLVTLAARTLGGSGRAVLLLLPPLWILMEWARTQGYFAFPWGTLGYAWLGTPVAQLADTFGVWGLGLLTTAACALLATPFVPARPIPVSGGRASPLAGILPILVAGALLAAGWWAGSLKLQRELPQPELTALLVQGNFDPFGRVLGPGQEVDIQTRLTTEAVAAMAPPPDLVVWPEGAVIGGLRGQSGAQVRGQIQASSPESTFLVGARTSADGRSYNSGLVIRGGAEVDRYDKNYLVPFGERFPFVEAAAPLYRAVFGLFGLPMLEGTTPGETLDPLDSPLGGLGAYICYESVFPQVQRALVGEGAGVLVNITNDAWFSRGDGAQQHYLMGSMRAIETRRYIVRAGIDGITGLVDPLGRTVSQLPRHTEGVLAVQFSLSDEVTPFVRYGHLLLPVLAAWIVLGLVWRLRQR